MTVVATTELKARGEEGRRGSASLQLSLIAIQSLEGRGVDGSSTLPYFNFIKREFPSRSVLNKLPPSLTEFLHQAMETSTKQQEWFI